MRPGTEYLESLRDDREIWIYGERVKNVTSHPAFRTTARMLARLYDAVRDRAHSDVLTTATDTGNGGVTHPFYKDNSLASASIYRPSHAVDFHKSSGPTPTGTCAVPPGTPRSTV